MRQKTATKIFPGRGFIHQLPGLGNVSRSHVPAIINNRRWPFRTIRQVTISHNNGGPGRDREPLAARAGTGSAGAPQPLGSGLVRLGSPQPAPQSLAS